jgi:predicted dehydrogenase
LKDSSIEVIHVCTPNDSHAEISIESLESGKHVMCEKPMAKTAADARRMLEASMRTGNKLTIGYNNRFRADSRYLKEICEAGELGEIYFAKAHAIRRRAVPTWGVFLDEEKQGGGPLIDIGTHALDLTLWAMNNYEPKVVLGRTHHKLSQTKNAANAFGSWNPEEFTVEDSAFAMIQMKNGASIVLETSWALNMLDEKEAKCTLCGTLGGADMEEGLRLNGEKNSRLYTNSVELNTGEVAFFKGEAESDVELEARLWIEAVVNDTDPIAIYKSSKTGEAIYF